jgi:hypothetical protein
MTTITDNPITQAQWDAANCFLDQLFLDPMLANNYQQISQQANGQDNAPEVLTTWLQEQGYDTTPDLVYAALINLQNTSLGYWTGIYGQSFLENSQPAPVLAIAPNTEGNTVAYLDGVELKNFVFESVETDNVFHPTLSWDLENNETAGHITFYYTPGVTLDPEPPTGYTGNWFEGTLQTSVSSSFQRYYGAIGEPTDSSAIPQLILADGEGESFWDKYSTYFYIGIGVFGFISAIVIIGVFVYRKRNVPERDFEEKEPLKSAKEWEKEWEKEWNKEYKNSEELPKYKDAMKKAKTEFGNQKISKSQYWQFLVEETLLKNDIIHVLDIGRPNGVGARYDLTPARQSDSNLRDSIEEEEILQQSQQFSYIQEAQKVPVEFQSQRRTGPSFQPPVSKISQKEIKNQKELFSKLDLASLNYIANTELGTEVKKAEISRTIETVINTIYQSQDSYIINDWNKLVEEGKTEKFFQKPDKNSSSDWIQIRDSWLNEIYQTLHTAQSKNLEQKKETDSKAIEPPTKPFPKNKMEPGDNTQKTSGSTQQKVISTNPEKAILKDKVLDPSQQTSNEKKDPEKDDPQKSKKEPEELGHRVSEK